MSVEALASMSRSIAADTRIQGLLASPDGEVVPTEVGGIAATEGAPETGGLPQTLTDAQGRVFRLQADPLTGQPQYRHAAEQRDETGNLLALEILLSLAPDGSFTRRTTQDLKLASGDTQHEVVLASHDAKGVQVGELVESTSKEGSATTSERTVGTFAAGKLVRRETDIVQRDQGTDLKTKETTTITAKIRGTWDNGGKEITADVVPMVDRSETQHIASPGQGINKDTDRTLTFTRHAAGPVNKLDWDDSGSLVVRFEGRNGQYLERELKVPLDQETGAPNMAKAETIRTEDKQNLLNKGLMQTRIWGGLASNLSWIIGINFARGSLGNGFLAFSAATAGAQLLGETHAVVTKRNDGDWGRVASSAYDVLLTGMLAAFMANRRAGHTQLTNGQALGISTLGASGLAINGAELTGMNPIGADALTQRLNSAGIGAMLAQPEGRSPLDGNWRLEPRFDAARALLG